MPEVTIRPSWRSGKSELDVQPRRSWFRNRKYSESQPDEESRPGKPWLIDPEQMKDTVRRNLFKEVYDVSKLYHTTGLWRDIATSSHFEKITLTTTCLNAIWIGIDTDYNNAEMLFAAHPVFQIAEHLFCAFFSFEWFARFMAFRRKADSMLDRSFLFDSVLAFLMVTETWLLSLAMAMLGTPAGASLGNASILRMARLARLSRMGRIVRVLRCMPELMILIKGLAIATRSVFCTLMLLALLIYVVAVLFTQITAGTSVGEFYFCDVLTSMHTLLVYGALMDNLSQPLEELGTLNLGLGALYLLFVLAASTTIMNMIIGVLCEIVSAVAAAERELLALHFVRERLQKVLKEIDGDASGTISKDEFLRILESRDAVEAMDDIGVDVLGVADMADFIFVDEDDTNCEKDLSFEEFMNVMLKFRGSNHAKVRDLVDLHKFMKMKLDQITQDMRELGDWLKHARKEAQ